MRGAPATARRAGPWGPLAWRTDRLDSHRRPCEEGRMPRAVVIHASGGPEVLSLERHDPGVPGAGAVRVRVNAAGVNFIDVSFRTGLYPAPLPFVVGLEGAGVVEAVGEGVAGLAPGDRVAWASVPGSYAEAVVAPADRLVRVPDAVPLEVAAASMLQGMTAHYLVHGTRETRPGDVALVHAAAGGVGLLLVQMLKAAGAPCSAPSRRVASGCAAARASRSPRRPPRTARSRAARPPARCSSSRADAGSRLCYSTRPPGGMTR